MFFDISVFLLVVLVIVGQLKKSTTKVAKQPWLSEGEGAGAKAPAHPGYAQPEFCSCPDDYSVG